MTYPVNYAAIKPNLEFYSEVVTLYNEASNYLLRFNWCEQIIDCDLYLNLGSVLCVFVFEIKNSASSNDNLLWIIVGDLPPMYLDTHGAKTTKEVLEDYISLASEWIENIKEHKSVEDCYPFDAKPTVELAGLFDLKISFIRDTLIDEIEVLKLKE